MSNANLTGLQHMFFLIDIKQFKTTYIRHKTKVVSFSINKKQVRLKIYLNIEKSH
jgi:hypothetical protein